MNLLEQFDLRCKAQRAELIASNYQEIVGNIHNYFDEQIIKNMKVVEIVKFDYMTNVHETGDQYMWVNFFDDKKQMNKLEVIINSEEIFILNDKQYSFVSMELDIEAIKVFSKMCLKVFRRGYDKPM